MIKFVAIRKDEENLAKLKTVRIVHGKGTGKTS